MKGIKDMVNARRDENDLERETTLFNMCDGINAEIDQLTKGISMGSGIDGSTATNSKRQTSSKYGLEQAKASNLNRSDVRESNKRGSERRSFNIFNKERNSALNNSRL